MVKRKQHVAPSSNTSNTSTTTAKNKIFTSTTQNLKEYRIVIKLPADSTGKVQICQGPRLSNNEGQKLYFSTRGRQVLSVWVHNAGNLPQGYIDTVVGYTKQNSPASIKYKTVVDTMAYMRAHPSNPTQPKPKRVKTNKVKRTTQTNTIKPTSRRPLVQPVVLTGKTPLSKSKKGNIAQSSLSAVAVSALLGLSKASEMYGVSGSSEVSSCSSLCSPPSSSSS